MKNTSRPQTSRTKIRRAVLVCEHPLLGERMVSQSHLKRPTILGLHRLAYNECPQKGNLAETAERVVRRLFGHESDALRLRRLGMFSLQNGLLPHDIESTVFLLLPVKESQRHVLQRLDARHYVKPRDQVLHELNMWRRQRESLLRAS